MTLHIKNVQYFEWKVPEPLAKNIDTADTDKLQQLIDEYFMPDSSDRVEQISDDYYELEQYFED